MCCPARSGLAFFLTLRGGGGLVAIVVLSSRARHQVAGMCRGLVCRARADVGSEGRFLALRGTPWIVVLLSPAAAGASGGPRVVPATTAAAAAVAAEAAAGLLAASAATTARGALHLGGRVPQGRADLVDVDL